MKKQLLHLNTRQLEIPHFIGVDLLGELGTFLNSMFPKHAVYVISDSNVFRLYSEITTKILSSHKCFREILFFPAGEESKSREQKALLEDILLERKAGRDTVLVAMGGGVTGDLVGYLAATLHRGVPLIHVPTSLLAMVDSSIGGKVGINHPAGKNLIGAFYQPQAVFTDISFLNTLPDEEFKNGMAEVIKYAVILDDELWDWLEQEAEVVLRKDLLVLERIIDRCVHLKIQVVEEDEKESNYRSILNFGHTLGHAIEKLSRFQIKHGFAVAKGMELAAKISQKYLGYPEERVERLLHLIKKYDLDRVDLKNYPTDALWDAMISDKKAREQQPRFTLMEQPGKPRLFYPLSKKELENVLQSE